MNFGHYLNPHYLILSIILVMFSSLTFAGNSLWAEGQISDSDTETVENSYGSPLDEFQKYRTQYAKDTARKDMEDNGSIDNSILTIRYMGPQPGMSRDNGKSADSVISLWTEGLVSNSDDDFVYHWEQDASVSGYEYSSYINEPLQVTILDEKITIPDNSASLKLQHDYGILLSNEGIDWQQDHSYAILEMMKTIPQDTRNYNQKQNLVTSKWILTDEHIDDDIRITTTNSFSLVIISLDAFENANPKLALIEDKRGKFFSQRLHHTLVWFVTDEGKDEDAVERILNERFGVSTKVSDFKKLTKLTTNESEKSFQEFHSWELVELINMFEEMPGGFHSVEGLDYLVRRADGLPHPNNPFATAVSWPSVNPGYIEFMESAFTANDSYLHSLILHEKSHFLWRNLFSDQLKNDWNKIGGWYTNDNGLKWFTSKTTEFVSTKAHSNPDEDMAESIAYFITNPENLKSRSLPKYEFIRDRIMQGNIYESIIREDLTFSVYNLYPDYIYPGKIIRVDISIKGDDDQDKHATIEIELSTKNKFEGAKKASFRLFSEIGTYVDVGLRPVDELGSVLRGEIDISKYSKNGFWYPNQIKITDQVGNQRFEGQKDFGWKFFINNSDEDVIPPEYVKNTLKLTKRKDTTPDGKPIQILTVSWQVNENTEMKNCYANILNDDPESYSIGSWGNYDIKNNTCNVDIRLTEFYRSGIYSFRNLSMQDEAGNNERIKFTELSETHSILINTENPDTQEPYLDVNNISISAVPTNPQEPNGETQVKIVYYAKDDKSGLGFVSYSLHDPQGIPHNNFHYHENFYGLFFKGKPDELARYEINLVLPEGSPPGEWGLSYIHLTDKATNKKTYEFTEIIHFNKE